MTILDVREEIEFLEYHIPGSVHIPLGKLRGRLDELDKNKMTAVICSVGIRAYNAARILMQNGFGRYGLWREESIFISHSTLEILKKSFMLFRQKYRDALLTWEKEGVRKETIIYRYIFQKFYDIIVL